MGSVPVGASAETYARAIAIAETPGTTSGANGLVRVLTDGVRRSGGGF